MIRNRIFDTIPTVVIFPGVPNYDKFYARLMGYVYANVKLTENADLTIFTYHHCDHPSLVESYAKHSGITVINRPTAEQFNRRYAMYVPPHSSLIIGNLHEAVAKFKSLHCPYLIAAQSTPIDVASMPLYLYDSHQRYSSHAYITETEYLDELAFSDSYIDAYSEIFTVIPSSAVPSRIISL